MYRDIQLSPDYFNMEENFQLKNISISYELWLKEEGVWFLTQIVAIGRLKF